METDGEIFKFTVADPLGLHARPAAEISSLAKDFQLDVLVGNSSGKWVSGSSPLLLLTLKLRQGDELFVSFPSGSTSGQTEFLNSVGAMISGTKP